MQCVARGAKGRPLCPAASDPCVGTYVSTYLVAPCMHHHRADASPSTALYIQAAFNQQHNANPPPRVAFY